MEIIQGQRKSAPFPFSILSYIGATLLVIEINKKLDNMSFFLILLRGDKTYLFLDPLFIEAVKNFEQFMIALLNAVFRESRIYY